VPFLPARPALPDTWVISENTVSAGQSWHYPINRGYFYFYNIFYFFGRRSKLISNSYGNTHKTNPL
jgi:hypothetical protein